MPVALLVERSANKFVNKSSAMTLFSALAFIAVGALYIKWNYASPYVGKAELDSPSFLRKSIPLLLFVAAGVLGTLSLSVASNQIFYVLFGLAATCLIAAPLITYVNKRRR